jgi:hypothetical protein
VEEEVPFAAVGAAAWDAVVVEVHVEQEVLLAASTLERLYIPAAADFADGGLLLYTGGAVSSGLAEH